MGVFNVQNGARSCCILLRNRPGPQCPGRPRAQVPTMPWRLPPGVAMETPPPPSGCKGTPTLFTCMVHVILITCMVLVNWLPLCCGHCMHRGPLPPVHLPHVASGRTDCRCSTCTWGCIWYACIRRHPRASGPQARPRWRPPDTPPRAACTPPK